MNRLVEFFNRGNTDAILIVGGSNILYATAYKADYAYVLITSTTTYYLTDSRFTLEAKAFLSGDYEIVDINQANAFVIIRDLLEKHCIKTIGFDADISHYQYMQLSQELSNYTLVDITDNINNLRAIKQVDEIKSVVEAQRIAEKSLKELLPSIVEGVTELELSAKLEYLMRINGSEGASFNSIVAFGANSAFAHARPSGARLKVGDIILIDFGAKRNGYCSDMTRTFVYREVSPQIATMYNAVLDANKQAIKYLKCGITAKQADAVAREVLAKYSLDNYFTHSLGHGVGVDIHEFPSLSPRASEVLLRTNMLVTVEPGVYIEGVGGIRIEDMLVIGEDGSQNLTAYNKELTIIK